VGRVLIAEVRPVDRLPSAFTVSTDESSQFASSILLAAAAIAHRSGKPCKVRLEGARVSEGYLQMTVRWMTAVGFDVSPELTVAWNAARPLPPIPGDWSSIGYLLLFAWTSGGRVLNLSNPALHPDGGLIGALASVGLVVSADGSVNGTLGGALDVSAKPFPDSIPTLVALACVLPSASRFSECAILRGKESDRLEACAALARAGGAIAVIENETLTVTPGTVPALRFDCGGDHRMAMAAAVLAALAKVPLALKGAQSVRKSFPGFWTEALKAGVEAEVLA
jgi:3-phosphoshikimate 1-carboxyvinyltransferase